MADDTTPHFVNPFAPLHEGAQSQSTDVDTHRDEGSAPDNTHYEHVQDNTTRNDSGESGVPDIFVNPFSLTPTPEGGDLDFNTLTDNDNEYNDDDDVDGDDGEVDDEHKEYDTNGEEVTNSTPFTFTLPDTLLMDTPNDTIHSSETEHLYTPHDSATDITPILHYTSEADTFQSLRQKDERGIPVPIVEFDKETGLPVNTLREKNPFHKTMRELREDEDYLNDIQGKLNYIIGSGYDGTRNKVNGVDVAMLRKGIDLSALGKQYRAPSHDRVLSVRRSQEFNGYPEDIRKELVNRKLKGYLKKDTFPLRTQDLRAFDFLQRASVATETQLIRSAGGSTAKGSRARWREHIQNWIEAGFVKVHLTFAGVPLYYISYKGARLTFHSYIGSTPVHRINPSSQSHTLGLASLGSWLLAPPRVKTPDILGLGEEEWNTLKQEILHGQSRVLFEKEYRRQYSHIRTQQKGVLPYETRHIFETLWTDWARKYQAGQARLEDSPDYKTTDVNLHDEPEYMYLWTIFANVVYNEGQWVDVERRIDPSTNTVKLDYLAGDKFTLLDHLADMIIVRKRNPDDGTSNNLAIELELTPKSSEAYARTMASYISKLGKSLFKRVIWLVPNATVGTYIQRGANAVGAVVGRDYTIIPFATQEMRNSLWTGSDLYPAQWAYGTNGYTYIKPLVDLSKAYEDVDGSEYIKATRRYLRKREKEKNNQVIKTQIKRGLKIKERELLGLEPLKAFAKKPEGDNERVEELRKELYEKNGIDSNTPAVYAGDIDLTGIVDKKDDTIIDKEYDEQEAERKRLGISTTPQALLDLQAQKKKEKYMRNAENYIKSHPNLDDQ